MPRAALLVCRAQAAVLVAVVVFLVVRFATAAHGDAGIFVFTVVIALLAALLLGVLARYRRARSAILLLELIALGITGQLIDDGRLGYGLAVGIPALVAVVTLLGAVGATGAQRRG